jgi:hypothetical protein
VTVTRLGQPPRKDKEVSEGTGQSYHDVIRTPCSRT